MEDMWQRLEHAFGENHEKISSIRNAISGEKLVIFLGAGVSISAGLPGWGELMRRLLKKTCPPNENNEISNLLLDVHYNLHRDSPLILGQQIENLLGVSLIDSVRKVLYQNVCESNIIKGVASLCKKSRSIQFIVTYNYDDLLEKELSKNGIEYNVVTSPPVVPKNNQVNIIHVHGFVPQNHSENGSKECVLGENSYHILYNNPYDWRNVIQLAILLQFDSIFIGYSFNDPNLRRLLQLSKSLASNTNRYAILRKFDRNNIFSSIMSMYKNKNAIENQTIQIAERILTQLSDYSQQFIDLQVGLYTKLGLDLIWVLNYDNIPSVLESLGDDGNSTY